MLKEEYIITWYDDEGDKIGFSEPISYYPTIIELEYAAEQSPNGVVFVEKFFRLEGHVRKSHHDKSIQGDK